jgi:hypothetical protein
MKDLIVNLRILTVAVFGSLIIKRNESDVGVLNSGTSELLISFRHFAFASLRICLSKEKRCSCTHKMDRIC